MRQRTNEGRIGRRQFVLIPLALAVARWDGALAMVLPAGSGHRGKHPEPRAGITAANVLPADRLPERKRVRRVFDMAREIPEVLDGLCCHCDCEQSHGHRSLLSCFESEQAIGCLACKEEAELAYKLHKEGKTLAEIRTTIDEEMG